MVYFDGVWFEKNVFRNSKLKKDFENWKTAGTDTKHFYDHIDAKYHTNFKDEVSFSYLILLDYKNRITSDDKKDDKIL